MSSTTSTPRRPVRRSRRVLPTGRGVVLAAVAVCCAVTGWVAKYPGLLGLGIAAAVTVAVSMIGLATRRGVTVDRNLPDRPIRRLRPLTGQLRIEPHAGAPGGEVDVTERVDGRRLAARRLAVTNRVTTIDYPIPTTIPGEVTIGPAELAFVGFAGLTRMRVLDRSTMTVLVLARSLPVRLPENGALPVESPRADEVEGGGTELRSLRPYVPGDDLRKVNARISARVGRLMIRQDAEPSISSVNLVLDNVSGTDPETFAEMLDVATSVAGAAVHAGLPIGWTARGSDGWRPISADGLGAAEVGLATLTMTDDPIGSVPGGDLTVVVCGPGSEPAEVVRQVSEFADLGLLILLRVGDDDHEAAPGGPIPGVVLLQAPTAEMVLRRLATVDRNLAGAAR